HATGEAKSVARYGQYELVWNSDLALHIERRARMRWISHGAIDCAASADLNAAGLQDPLALCAATFSIACSKIGRGHKPFPREAALNRATKYPGAQDRWA